MGPAVSFFSEFAKRVREYKDSYPVISQTDETRSYYKWQNRSFPMNFLMLTVSMVVHSIVCSLMLALDNATLMDILMAILDQMIIALVVYIVACYMLCLRQSACTPENKKSFAAQNSIRNRIALAGLLPSIILTITPLFQPKSDKPEEVCSIGWIITLIIQLHACTWISGGALYHATLMFAFNAAYCTFSVWKGYFTALISTRLMVPVGLSAMFFIVLDRSNKENFVLKRALKQQKKMYQKFLQQMQDPVLMYSQESKLLFHNRAAKDWITSISGESEIVTNTGTVNHFNSLGHIVSPSRKATLEVDIKHRLSLLPEAVQSVSRERYYSYPNPKRTQEELKRREEELPRIHVKDCRRVLDVTLIESTTFSGSQKTVSLILHDATEELQKEEKKAEEKYKNMLLFSLSHELKTPLNVFQGFLDASKSWIRTEQMRNMLRDAKGAWRYLRNKINDILDYAQVLSDEFALHNSTFSLRRFVAYLRKITWCLLTEKRNRVRLLFEVSDKIKDDFEGDRERMEQVLFNFLCNATRFTEHGTISLTVTRTGDRDMPMITFTVKDTGCGMSREMANSLFKLNSNRRSCDIEKLLSEGSRPSNEPSQEPDRVPEEFYGRRGLADNHSRSLVAFAGSREEGKTRLQPSQNKHSLGPDSVGHKKSTRLSGLGLTISKMICTKMGCEIEVVSELGKGSSFSFSLPVRHSVSGDITASLPVKSAEPNYPGEVLNSDGSIPDENPNVTLVYNNPHNKHTGARKLPQTESVRCICPSSEIVALVVDDNYFNRYVAETMIRKFGIMTCTAENGKIAVERLEKLQTECPSSKLLVLMDVDMPVMDGIQATIAIRERGLEPRPYIIALTAFSAESERVKCLEAGMDAFIGKPITKERLVDVIEDLKNMS
ncbi:MAG: response regulator [Candidatus Pacebacteria bacterium]|nr:response regulator [Candidatus Paceibacterota bacterium]